METLELQATGGRSVRRWAAATAAVAECGCLLQNKKKKKKHRWYGDFENPNLGVFS